MYLINVTFTDALINILCSIAASIFFLFFVLYFLRPKIEISPYISKQADDQFKENKYVFKVINKSMYSAYDIQAELVSLRKYPVGKDNMNVRFTPLELKKNRLEHLKHYQGDKKCKPFALHAFLFNSYEPEIEAILADEMRSIQFSITAKHGLTGLSKNFKMEFATPDILKERKFKFGNSVETI